MARRRYPFGSMWREMEEMRADLDNIFNQTYSSGRFLPRGGVGDRILPAIRGEFGVDVREHDDGVIIVADLPGEIPDSNRIKNPFLPMIISNLRQKLY